MDPNEDDESIKVVVRVRKLLDREADQKKVFRVANMNELCHENSKKTWTFDRVYSAEENTACIYFETISNLVESVVSGFNATIFAYGQTSSGKTHTMMGTDLEPGITKQAVEQLFFAVEQTPERVFLMQVSYMEIYNESVMDLLGKPGDKSSTNLKIRENEAGEVYVEGAETMPVSSTQEVFRLMQQGEKNRHYAGTKMNERSSRSHTIFRIQLESMNNDGVEVVEEEDEEEQKGKHVILSYLNLVDLAGSERADQTGAEGSRLREGGNINKSLSMLGQVIMKLSSGDKSTFINYRDSKLTRLLQSSLGGNAKTAVIATVTPAQMSEEQTISTLRFASQAKTVKTHAKVNECLDDRAVINRLKEEMADLQVELESMKSQQNQGNADLQEELERLRKEKEEQIAKVRALEQKILVSSMPYKPSKKSIMTKFGGKDRRMTWAAPRLNSDSRASFGGFLQLAKPLPPLPAALAPVPSTPEVPVFKEAPGRLGSIEEEPEEANKVNTKKRRTVMFKSPEPVARQLPALPEMDSSMILDISMDNGTPKALIRDKYKRVSMRLSQREQELQHLEREYKELEEFSRLEQEAGVTEERRQSRSTSLSSEDMDRLRVLERNYADAESLNLELNKKLRETQVELDTVTQTCQQVTASYESLKQNEADFREKCYKLEDQTKTQAESLKSLTEKCTVLEGHKQDFDMQMELALDRKHSEIQDLRSALECAYSEISALEQSDSESVRRRVDYTVELKQQLKKLQEQLSQQESPEQMKNELESQLREQFDKMLQEQISKKTAEQESLIEELKSKALEGGNSEELLDKKDEEIKHLKEGLKMITEEMDNLVKEKSTLEEQLQEADRGSRQEMVDTLQLSQQEKKSLVETIEQLTREKDQLSEEYKQKLVQDSNLSEDLKLKIDELDQYKKEVEQLKSINEEFKSQNDELKSCVSDNDSKNALNQREMENLKSELDEVKAVNSRLESEMLSKNHELETELETVKSAFNEMTEKATNAESELSKAVGDLKESKEKEESLNRDISDLKSLQGADDYNRLRAEFESRLQEKESEFSSMTLQMETSAHKYEQEIEQLKAKCDKLKESSGTQDNLQIELEKVTSENTDLNKQIVELQSLLDNAGKSSNDETELLQHLEELKKERDQLKESLQMMHNRSQVFTSDKEDVEAMSCELNRLRLAQEDLCRVQDENRELSEKVVSLRNNQENLMMTNSKLKKFQEENEELKEVLDRMSSDMENLRGSEDGRELLEKENKALKEKLDLFDQVRSERDRLKSSSSQSVDLVRENSDLQDILKNLENELDQVKSANVELTEKNSEASKLFAEMREKETRFLSVQSELDELRKSAKNMAALQDENRDVKEALAGISAELNNVKSLNERLEDGNREMRLKTEQFEGVCAELEKYRVQNLKLSEEMKNKAETTDGKATEAELEQLREKCLKISNLEAENAEKSEKLAEVQDELDILKSSIDELSEMQDEFEKLKAKELQSMEMLKEVEQLKDAKEQLKEVTEQLERLQQEHNSLRSKGGELAERLQTRNSELDLAHKEIVRLQEFENSCAELQDKISEQQKEGSNASVHVDPDVSEQLKMKDEQILEIHEELEAWRHKSREIMSLLSSKDEEIATEPDLLARIMHLKDCEARCVTMEGVAGGDPGLDRTASAGDQDAGGGLVIQLQSEVEEFRSRILEQNETLARLHKCNRDLEESNTEMKMVIRQHLAEVEEIKSRLEDKELVIKEKNDNIQGLKRLLESKEVSSDEIASCTMDFTLGIPGLAAADMTGAGTDLMTEMAANLTGTDLMSELASAAQKNRTLKEATLQQLNLTLGNLDETLRGLADQSMLPPADRSMLTGSGSAEKSMLPPADRSIMTGSGSAEKSMLPPAERSMLPPSDRSILPSADRSILPSADKSVLQGIGSPDHNETINSGKMLIDIGEILEMKNQLEMLQEQLINFDLEEFNRNKIEIVNLKQQNTGLSEKIEEQISEQKLKTKELEEANGTLRNLKTQLESLSEDLSEEKLAKEKIVSQNQRLESQVNCLSDELADLREDNSRMTDLKIELKKLNVELEQEIAKMDAEIGALQKGVERSAELENEIDLANRRVEEAVKEKQALQERVEIGEKAVKELEDRLDVREKAMEEIRRNSHDETLVDVQHDLVRYQHENETLKELLSQLEASKSVLQSDLDKKVEEVCLLQEVRSELDVKESELQDLQASLTSSRGEVEKLRSIVSDLSDVNEKLKVEAKTSANTHSQDVGTYEARIKILQDQNNQLGEKIDDYESKIPIFDEMKSRLASMTENNETLSVRIDELLAENESLKSKLDQASANHKENAELKENEIIASLTKDNEDLRFNMNKLKEEHEDIQTKFSDFKESVEVLKKMYSDVLDENERLKEGVSIQESTKANTELEEKMKKLEEEHAELQSKYETTMESLKILQKFHSDVLDENDRLKEEAVMTQTGGDMTAASLLEDNSNLKEKIKKLEEQHEELQSKHDTTVGGLKILQKFHSDVLDENDRLKEEAAMSQTGGDMTAASLLEDNSNLKEKIKKLEEQHEELQSKHDTTLDGLKILQKFHSDVLDENDRLKEDAAKQELQLSSQQVDRIVNTQTRDAMRDNLEALEDKLRSENEEKMAAELEAVRSRYESQISELSSCKTRHETRIEELEAEIGELHSRQEAFVGGQQKQQSVDVEQDELMQTLEKDKLKLESELREKNLECSSLKIDMHRGEINFQKAKKKLQDELEYEKSRVGNLTRKIRSLEADRMDTTFQPQEPKSRVQRSSVSRSTNTTESESGSPGWGSGSGLYKEVRLYELEHKTDRLEKELKKGKMEIEFYRKRGTDWKSHAKWYEEILDHHKIRYRKPYQDKENQQPAEVRHQQLDTTNSKAAPLANKESDRTLGQLEAGLGSLALGSQGPQNPSVLKMKQKAQEVFGVQKRSEPDPVVLQKERPPNDCPTQ